MAKPEHTGPVPVGRDADEYDRQRRRVLWSMPTGIYILGSRSEGRRNMMTCNWAVQVATAPKLVAVSVEVGSLTRALVDEGGSFTLSILARSDRALVRRFVKPVDEVELDGDGRATSLQGVPVHEVVLGLPCVSSAMSWMACVVRHTLDWDRGAGDGASHVLYVGEVVDVGEREASDSPTPDSPLSEGPSVLQMGDTRMNYGG